MRKKEIKVKSKMHQGVPDDNVLDLKKMAQEKESNTKSKSETVDRVTFWDHVTEDISRDRMKGDRQKIKQDKKAQKKILREQRILEKEKLSELHKQKKAKPISKPEPRPEKQKTVKKERRIRRDKVAKPGIWWLKNATVFVVVAIILIAPIYVFGFYKQASTLKDSVIEIANLAYADLLLVEDNITDFDFESAGENLDNAVNNFSLAQEELDQMNSTIMTLAKLFPTTRKQIDSAEGLLEAGKSISLAGKSIALATVALTEFDSNDENIGFTTPLFLAQVYLQDALSDLQAAEISLQKVDVESIPEGQRDKISLLKQALPTINQGFEEFYNLTDGLLEILGHSGTKRYLLLFQNNHEIRPTGGFIGSLALIDINKGIVKNLEVPSGGPYDLSGQLKEKLIAPEPLHLVNPHWQIQDANWWFDFPTSADKIIWFYEKSGGPTVDGIITLTPTVIENLLEVTGPIDMEDDYQITITRDNFVEFAQHEVERDHEDNPKQFIADLAPKLLNQLLEGKDNWFSVLKVLASGLSEKHILLYFTDQDLEDRMIELGWAGEVKETDGDYLAVVNTNISGGKTDGVIDQVVNHKVQIRNDGSIVDTVQVTRVHKGKKGEEFKGVKNINYIRFYVPEGSELIEADGFSNIWKNLFLDPDEDYSYDEDLLAMEEGMIIDARTNTRINDESGKTVFGNWIAIEPGETSTVTIKYLLPFKIDLAGWNNNYDSYSLFIQKQPGSLNSFFSSEITWPGEMEIQWVYPTDGSLQVESNSVELESILDVDQLIGVILKKKD